MRDRTEGPYSGRTPPWPTPDQWQAANEALAAALETRRRRFSPIRDLAGQIQARITALDGRLDALCAGTCHGCEDNCCQRATVWYDFKDLLGFHLAAVPLPAQQFVPQSKHPCQYLGPTGCTLPRIQRPFVCTWYLCPAQRQAMAAWAPSRRQFLGNSLMALKSGRNRMERYFLQQVVT